MMRHTFKICSAVILVAVFLAFATPPDNNARAAGADLVVVTHPDTNTGPLSRSDLYDIFTSQRKRWGDGAPVIAFNQRSTTDARSVFNRAVMQMSRDEVVQFWIDQRIRHGTRAPRDSPSDAMLMRLASARKGVIGYVASTTAGIDKLQVVARISGDKVLSP